VTSFIDVDVTSIVTWRNKVKNGFLQRNGEKITFTPVFIDAVAKALHEFPQINASVDGYKVIYRKNINIGMATALPNGNLIVPVIKNVNEKSLLGIVKAVNSLAQKARQNALVPDEIQGGTFTVTNFGSFDSLTGTPIINQPQVAILGVGAIRKKPVVLETSQGDVIAIRHIMILSLAYDHRIVDGALGGLFLKRLKEILENWDVNTEI
jgi:2-oxoglutarate dehydrogenase E2 component (dihydrolipoamide succinyltransferase)